MRESFLLLLPLLPSKTKKQTNLRQFTSASSCFRASQIGSDALSDWKRARRLGEGAGSEV